MGRLLYDNNGGSADFDDRVLAHLQVAMGSKLRRGESFFLTWHSDVTVGSGRNSVWISPVSPLSFRYSGNRAPSISQAWVEAMVRSANTPAGLRVMPEPDGP